MNTSNNDVNDGALAYLASWLPSWSATSADRVDQRPTATDDNPTTCSTTTAPMTPGSLTADVVNELRNSKRYATMARECKSGAVDRQRVTNQIRHYLAWIEDKKKTTRNQRIALCFRMFNVLCDNDEWWKWAPVSFHDTVRAKLLELIDGQEQITELRVQYRRLFAGEVDPWSGDRE